MVVIGQIVAEIASIPQVWLLNVDPGRDANRTVITFAGEPVPVVEAAFRAIKKAGEVIDMRSQTGEHPRMGATDVCPLVPLRNITMEETVGYADQLAERVGNELQIPVYLYEHSQSKLERSNLSVIRSGGYEGFFKKIKLPQWQPDYGPTEMDARRGATVIGARNFLVAFNINLNTTSVEAANAVAQRIRESGVKVPDGGGSTKRISGSLKFVKAIGWYMAAYGCAQVSMNLTDIDVTPVHAVFEEVKKQAKLLGIEVTGSELIGLIPLKAMLEAGKYYLEKKQERTDVSESTLVDTAINAMGLNQLGSFDPGERIIEYLLSRKLAE